MICADDVLDKSILEILAIRGECDGVVSIHEYLRRLSQETGGFSEISEDDVVKSLEKLRTDSSISVTEEGLWTCNRGIRTMVLWNMLKEDRYRSVAMIIRRYSYGYLENLNFQMAFYSTEEERKSCREKSISDFFKDKKMGDLVNDITPYLYKTSFDDLDLVNGESRSIAYMVFIIHSLNDLVSKDLFFSMVKRISMDSIIPEYRDFIGYHGALTALLMDNFKVGMDLLCRLNLDPTPLEAVNAYLRGNNDEAIKLFRLNIMKIRKKNGKRQGIPQNVTYLFYLLALLESDSIKNYEEAISLGLWFSRKTGREILPAVSQGVACLALRRLGRIAEKDVLNLWFLSEYWESINGCDPYKTTVFWALERLILLVLMEVVDDGGSSRKLITYLEEERSGVNIEWFRAEKSVLINVIKDKMARLGAVSFYEDTGYVPLAGRFKLKVSWEKTLFSLKNYVLDQTLSMAEDDKKLRIVWLVGTEGKKPFLNIKLSVLEQTLGRQGKWSKGRLVPLARLLKDPLHDMTPSDLSILHSYSLNPTNGVMELDELRCLDGLAANPFVFSDKDRTAELRVKKENLSLVLEKKVDSWTLKTVPALDPSKVKKKAMIWWSDKDLCYCPLSKRNRALAMLVGKDGISIPLEGISLLTDTLEKLSEVVNITPALDALSESVSLVEADHLPHLQFSPVGAGFRIRFGVRPLGKNTPFFSVAKGRKRVFTVVDGLRQTVRVFEKERLAFENLTAHCSLLMSQNAKKGIVDIETVEEMLILLSELEDLSGMFQPEWPEGQKLSLLGKAQIDKLSLRVESQKDWLSVDGSIALKDDLVLSLMDVLKSLGRSKGLFVPLGDGAFVKLSSELRKKLEDLDSLSSDKEDSLMFSSMAVPVLEEMSEDVALFGDDKWNSLKGRLEESQSMKVSVPLDLNATLRDYQEDGFRWMARLSHWSGGACLADDMGLGKTVQAIALLLYRASMGAALVVAPTSVCSNWKDECQRFAPSLNVVLLSSSNREKTIKEAAPGDIVLSSWGLLKQERELLTSREWQTVVLDEAQAIKNPRTVRAQAAFALRSSCRLALTGTPIENRLSELWSLFRFLNPGFFGSSDSFRKKYVLPIEQDGDPRVKRQLKKMISPFMLRRSKEEVLNELPPLTEVTIEVDLSDEEKGLYEALRRQALDRLKLTDSHRGGGVLGRFQILAELTRLRRAACNPRLAVPETSIESSKMRVFTETLEEIIKGGHKALVFSQFTGHLALAREALDSRKILYQYLDGATPGGQRKKRVDAFQSGEGDCFLISLRAGGLGLNLTAADYVIHLDPWWNPAVEDQASDRAHRFGQNRPVTVYRILSRGTVEEKIVALHRKKRDLAESLLDGTNCAVNLTEKDFMDLIGQSMV